MHMKISILLPTRNRLDYLKLAIETVLRQDSPDWEIAVSDNDSSEDIAGHVASLEDDRILYRRTERFLPVTDNWNEALRMSSGDYVVMMGDDDALLPGYITHMSGLVDHFERPDMIYVGSLLFTYPGVDPNHAKGFLSPNSYAEFLDDNHQPFILSREQAETAVRKTMDFRHVFNFNMQLSLINRRLIEELRPQGDFFQSPFPDFYAMCVALLKARHVVVEPRPQVVIGVTPKSYGFFHLNEREREGRAFLNADHNAQTQLPGTNINEGWLGAMETIEAGYGTEFGLSVNRRRYRLVQAGHVYTRSFRGVGSKAEVERLEASLNIGERLAFRSAHVIARVLARVLPPRLWTAISRRSLGQSPAWEPVRQEGVYTNILDVFEHWQDTQGHVLDS
jgi:glycosyltransferase involved in cell wall biosynthesis